MTRRTPSPRWRQLLVAIILLALGWASYVVSVQYGLLLPHEFALRVLGGVLIVIGVAIRVVAFVEIPNTYRIETLVTTGVYAKTRNPIYLSFMLIFIGIAVFSAAVLALVWACVCVAVLYWIAALEETDLERSFGERYVQYKKTVPMFVPRFANKEPIDRSR
ncbi:MAG TPA: isoprenylcysteine carboxylmethyltransferase family protein [Candidatus Bathyarchaeia archaeon]|nr:isoprenylcysteine carboxylmethyltransferase family protein [Candidatus Bathyarchaeia archaeon]